jgi:hypothetical protein
VIYPIDKANSRINFIRSFVDQAMEGKVKYTICVKGRRYNYIQTPNTPTFIAGDINSDNRTNKNFFYYISNRYQFEESDRVKNNCITLLEGRPNQHSRKCLQDLCTTNFLCRFIYNTEVFLTFVPCSLKVEFQAWALEKQSTAGYERSIPKIIRFPTPPPRN